VEQADLTGMFEKVTDGVCIPAVLIPCLLLH